MTIASTPDHKGTPPPAGFASWEDFTRYVLSQVQVQAIPVGTAVTQFGEPVGGIAELPSVTNC